MDKSVRKKGGGILGAIRAVTPRPAVRSVDPKELGSVPGTAGQQSPASRSPSALMREIEESKSEREVIKESPEREPGLSSSSTEQPQSIKIESKDENRQSIDQKVNRSKQSPEPDIASVKSRKSSNFQKRELEVPEFSERKSSTSPQNGGVLPPSRPASINRDVDRILDSLNLKVKDTAYLLEKIRSQISNNLLQSKVDDICEPDMSIVGPVLSTLQYVVHQPQMVTLFSNLISTAMSRKTARFAHPGFVDLIRNTTEDEARILSWFHREKILPVIDIKKVLIQKHSEMRLNTLVSAIAEEAGCEFDDLAEGYLANLERIGLLEIPRTTCLSDDSLYQRVLTLPAVEERLSKLNTGSSQFRGEVVKYYAKLSIYGIKFCHACIR